MQTTYFNISRRITPQRLIVQEKILDLTFNWKYHNGYVDVSISGYFQKLVQNFHHQPPKSPQCSPFDTAPYVKAIKGQHQYTPTIYSSSMVPPAKTTIAQRVVGSFIYYYRAINNKLLPALNFFLQKMLLLKINGRSMS